MPLASGTRLGAYEITAAIGAGGMGEVYKARDTRLDRTVAIKVLPRHVADDAALRERFEREARTIGALNHPHICVLYDIGRQEGTDFLVLEYLDGQSLAEKLASGRPLPLAEALTIATQMADALDKAHRQGIVHRDLKPANVMLTTSGAKLVDFGLAKRAAPAAAVSAMATEAASNLTAQGTILGTFQYMAPEQLEGMEADARSDIWAFGAVLYEMVTGKKAFEGRSHVSLIAAILEQEPRAVSDLQPLTPRALDHVIGTCLAKNPFERWQSIGDVHRVLEWIVRALRDGASSDAGAWRGRRSIAAQIVVAGSLLAAVAFASLWLASSPRPSASPLMRLRLDVPEAPLHNAFASLSPDGRQVAFVGPLVIGGKPQPVVWVRALDGVDDRPLAETIGASLPFWSPDSQSLGFFADRKLKRIDLRTGLVEAICEVPAARGGTWNARGTIVFAASLTSPLFRVDARPNSAPAPLTRLQPHESGHRLPAFVDDDHVVFTALKESGQNTLSVVSLDAAARHDLVTASGLVTQAQAVGGYLLFVRDGTLLAQRLDRTFARLDGEAELVARFVAADDYGWQAFSAAQGGVLIVRTEDNPVAHQLTWFAHDGRQLGAIWEPVSLRHSGAASSSRRVAVPFALSPDDRRVAVWRDEPSGVRALWIVDVARNTAALLTKDAGQELNKAIWSPDGARLVFGRQRHWGAEDLFERRTDGTGDDERLTNSDTESVPAGWLPDGRLLYAALDQNTSLTWDLWALSHSPDHRASLFLQVPISGASRASRLAVSPNGQWLAYMSNESGSPQVHVRSLGGSASAQVTRDGGANPAWSGDGSELFYASGGKLWAVSVRLGESVDIGAPKFLFDLPPDADFQPSHDGQRFLIDVPQAAPTSPGPASLTVFVNWMEELKQRVPTK